MSEDRASQIMAEIFCIDSEELSDSDKYDTFITKFNDLDYEDRDLICTKVKQYSR